MFCCTTLFYLYLLLQHDVLDALLEEPVCTFFCSHAEIHLTGTKLGCAEGGCGACTVMVSHQAGTKLVHRSVNACLCPLYAVEGMHVVTVEGGCMCDLLALSSTNNVSASQEDVGPILHFFQRECSSRHAHSLTTCVLRAWQPKEWFAPSPSSPGKGAWLSMWLLHTWLCHVNVFPA